MQTVSKIVNSRVTIKHKFKKVDNFTYDVIRREVYRFYERGQSLKRPNSTTGNMRISILN